MKVDVIVIGTGQAGVPLAARLTEAGKRVIIVEKGHLGGSCVNVGCTPTKTMVASARAAHVARSADRLGVKAADVGVDLAAVVDRKNEIVDQWRSGVGKRLERAGDDLTLIEGAARFVGEREIEVAGDRHSADIVIVNVGARPSAPPIKGLDSVDWLDNETIMEVRQLPDHLLIIGGGYIACEFGQMFRRFGSDVTIMQRSDHLVPREDVEASEAIENVFREEGIELVLGSEATEVEAAKGSITVHCTGGAEARGSHLLVATGRVPNTDDLGCDAAGIELDERGNIEVDDSFRTSAAGVYALGDCTGGPQFTHASWDDHRILYEILMEGREGGREGRITPSTVFTDPQIAQVGLTEREAKERGIEYEAASMPFGHIARAIETDERAGTMKVLIDPKSERVLGASIVGYEAGELIHVFLMLMMAGAPARALVDAQTVHPTLAEGLQSMVMKLDRYKLE
ncbi:MAG: mercuric reductase [Gemmatimonadetes bacterium]|uniref:Mercuric reductase n=1 Tax=Candidatus Kutchimonas denitrificans TaxID=3056748 RepID=A0AAE4Z8Z1_9BACT|nr:mercuric reductase [Gemmatimonadota bacterium]NIR74817.1 mercuric reductase [Candidatus Kutchimonas denitrificans]NIR99928.1 mercuric reductase [Gemmatimonadota bacterium]NIT65512.1 mercuric reductase [Gemmatimonadota bacterium]NIU52482.1 FAD-dependent oxidoreductase [Gemmatimonadota bacterium]